jgi:nitric oxide reductase subunit B
MALLCRPCRDGASGSTGAYDRSRVFFFWLYNAGLVLRIALNFFLIGWPRLNAVFEHGFAYARSVTFYNGTLFWQWMRFPGDVVFAVAALLMAWDFLVKLGPLFPGVARWLRRGPVVPLETSPAE